MVWIACALALDRKPLLLDEPTEGLSPARNRFGAPDGAGRGRASFKGFGIDNLHRR